MSKILFGGLLRSRRGGSMAPYVIMVGMVCAVGLATLVVIGGKEERVFSSVQEKIPTRSAAAGPTDSAPFINTASLPQAFAGVPYGVQLEATDPDGGSLNWSLASGILPPGITLSASGLLSGTAAVPSNYPIRVRVADGTGRSDALDLTLMVAPAPTDAVGDTLGEAHDLGMNHNAAGLVSVTDTVFPGDVDYVRFELPVTDNVRYRITRTTEKVTILDAAGTVVVPVYEGEPVIDGDTTTYVIRTAITPSNFGPDSGTFYVKVEPGAGPATGGWIFAFDSFDD